MPRKPKPVNLKIKPKKLDYVYRIFDVENSVYCKSKNNSFWYDISVVKRTVNNWYTRYSKSWNKKLDDYIRGFIGEHKGTLLSKSKKYEIHAYPVGHPKRIVFLEDGTLVQITRQGKIKNVI